MDSRWIFYFNDFVCVSELRHVREKQCDAEQPERAHEGFRKGREEEDRPVKAKQEQSGC